jgi:hypothetical protein
MQGCCDGDDRGECDGECGGDDDCDTYESREIVNVVLMVMI